MPGRRHPDEFERAGRVLAGRERHAGRLAQLAERVDVLGGPDRLLDPERIVRLHRHHGVMRRIGQPGAIHVDHDRNAGAGRLARRRDRLGGLLVQLDVAIAALERARHVALHVLDVAAIGEQRGIDLDAVALLAAEQRMHRHAFELAAQIPQREVEAGERVDERAGAAEIVQRALEARDHRPVGRCPARPRAARPNARSRPAWPASRPRTPRPSRPGRCSR